MKDAKLAHHTSESGANKLDNAIRPYLGGVYEIDRSGFERSNTMVTDGDVKEASDQSSA